MNINRILSVASRLMETGHYAAQHIGNVAAKLDQVSGAAAACVCVCVRRAKVVYHFQSLLGKMIYVCMYVSEWQPTGWLLHLDQTQTY